MRPVKSTVGTVVKSGEDDDPIAVMTALSTRRYAGRPFMGQVRDYVLRKCGDEELRRRFQEAWAAEGTALLINERLINSPPQLAPPLVQALFDEIQWATEDEPTQELRDTFKLQRYLLVTRVYTDPAEQQQQQEQQQDGSGAGPSSSKQRGKKKQKTASKPPGGIPLVIYVRPEDEFLHKRAAASFTWPIEGRAVPKDELRPMRLAMLVDARAAAEARRELDRVIGNAAGMAPPQLPAPAAGKGKRGGKQGGKK
ncbi:putative Protein BCCIP like protein [Monoraphidium neglectum]|uniref:Uncharacterized protein n=1 Tax=Monoraphidium neglectum TaxID=145388 RepID=A0A0D2J8I1_9CHLO|nr:putative Protein BCCIP like protein [Monoraphidium neglectum]KIY96067.1 putative Protein BCCIP like protein [Monoraphidium neglectum]|eukprot:XP_013895087.1 putative Protein BCCIP like protein [Monoraphidium neglectum]